MWHTGLEGHTKRPWWEFDVGQRGRYSKRLKMQIWTGISQALFGIMKFCTYVHLLIPNKFPVRTYQLHPFYFLLNASLWKMQCVEFGTIWWWSQNRGLLLPHTVITIIYIHMWLDFKQCLKQCFYSEMQVYGSTSNPLISYFAEWSRIITSLWLFDCLDPSLLIAAMFLLIFFLNSLIWNYTFPLIPFLLKYAWLHMLTFQIMS